MRGASTIIAFHQIRTVVLPKAGLRECCKGYCQVKWNSRVLEAKSVVGRT